MVYFQPQTNHKSGSISIFVVSINSDKTRLTYRFTNGTVRYTAPIHWSRVRNIDHPVQYINVKGRRIWAL